MSKTFVVSDASDPAAAEATFFHFWTPNGLTKQAGRASRIVEDAKRCGWTDTVAIVARTHREAVEEAHRIFTKRRARRRPS